MDLLRIKDILEEKELSVKEFSEMVGLSYTYCTELVRGEKFPRADALYSISKALDIDVRELFKPTKEEKSTVDLINELKTTISKLENKLQS